MAAKAGSTKPSPKREKALKKLKRVEDAALTLQASLPTFIREVQEVKEMLAGGDGGE